MGESGSGKSTLLNILAALDRPTKGKVYLKGRNLSGIKEKEMAAFRRQNLGFVFQDFYLLDSLSVEDNIMVPMVLDKAPVKDCLEKVAYYMEKFGLMHLTKKKPNELSGGERQRVAICRALINDPELILADEPTGNLDTQSGQIVIDALTEINEKMKKTILMVTHDPKMASYCSRIILLKGGQILEELKREKDQDAFYHRIVDKMQEL